MAAEGTDSQSPTKSNSREEVEHAISVIEAFRGALGDTVADTTLSALHTQLSGFLDTGRSGRRQVTAMFADLSGYTTLSEGLDPEQVLGLLSEFWDEVDAIITRHRGRVITHMGDGVMAIWGGERSEEDDAIEAVRAGLEAIEYLKAEGVKAGDVRSEAQMSIGLHTGLVHIGLLGTNDEFSAIGDTVNVAARLESLAEPGQVLISRQTLHQVTGSFEIVEGGEVPLKGRRQPVAVYVVVAEQSGTGRIRRRGVEGIDTSLVGRDPHMAVLAHGHQTVFRSDDGKGSEGTGIAVLVGAPGLGKSRLIEEHRDWIDANDHHIVTFEARCRPDTRDRPYHLIRSMLSHQFAITESEDPVMANQKLTAGLTEVAGEVGRRTAQTVGWLTGIGTPSNHEISDLSQGRSLAARRELLELLTALMSERRTLLVLEDLHWADAVSLDVLEELLADGPTGLRIIASARPEMRATRRSWLTTSSLAPRHDIVSLNALSDEHAAALVDDILRLCPEVPAELRDAIVGRADGSPFHIEELIKMLIDDGIIVPGPIWQVSSGEISLENLPTTLTGVLQSRLDHLPSSHDMLLRRASVVGRYFWHDLVASMCGLTDDEANKILADLIEAEFLFERVPSRFDGRREFGFSQDFTRMASYATVSLDARPELHKASAEWLSTVSPERSDEQAVPIARHLAEAGDGPGACDWLRRAASLANAQGAHAEAADLYQRAMEQPGISVAVHHRVSIEQAETLVVAGRYDDARSRLELLVEDPSLSVFEHGRAAAVLARIAFFRDGDSERGSEVLAEALDLLALHQSEAHLVTDEDAMVELGIRRQLGNLAAIEGDHPLAIEIMHENLERCSGFSLALTAKERAQSLLVLARALTQIGQHQPGFERAVEGLEIGQELNDMSIVARARIESGLALLGTGQPHQAWDEFLQARELAHRRGDPERVAAGWNYQGQASLELDHMERAGGEFYHGLDEAARCGAIREALRSVIGLSALAVEEGQIDLGTAGLSAVHHHPSGAGDVQAFARQIADQYRLQLYLPENTPVIDEIVDHMDHRWGDRGWRVEADQPAT